MAFDRYAYVFNSPLKYIDPDGHLSCSAKHVAPGDCSDAPHPLLYFVSDEGQMWSPDEIKVMNAGAWDIANKLAREMNSKKQKLVKLGETDGYVPITPREAFHQVYDGPVKVVRKGGTCAEEIGNTYPDCGGWAYTKSQNEIWVFSNASTDDIISHPRLIVHELGHAFENAVADNGFTKPRWSLPANVQNREGFYGPPLSWQLSIDMGNGEIFADMFIGWVYGKWGMRGGRLTVPARKKARFMSTHMPTFIRQAIP